MGGFSDNLSARFMEFAVNILLLEKQICRSYSGRHIFGQLFRAGTSAAANYEEGRAGESKADFIHKMQLVLKEMRESHFWITLILAGENSSAENEVFKKLNTESSELMRIIAKSIVTAKSNITRT